MYRKLGILLIMLSLLGAGSHFMGWALPSLRWFFGFGETTGYVSMAAAFLAGLLIVIKVDKDVYWRPMTLRKFERFKSIHRGYVSFWLFIALIVIALLDQTLVGKRALVVNYEGQFFFPAFQQRQYAGTEFGQADESEARYRDLKKSWQDTASENWLIMPIVPWDPVLDSQDLLKVDILNEDGAFTRADQSKPYSGLAYTYYAEDPSQMAMMYKFRRGQITGRADGFSMDGDPVLREQWEKGERLSREWLGELTEEEFDQSTVTKLQTTLYPALKPDLKNRHYLGTDSKGWDILATLYGGFQVVLKGAVLYLSVSYALGLTIGCLMGYFGGKFDIIAQRFIEILANIPFLFVVMIINSRLEPEQRTVGVIVGVMCIFSWIGMTYYMRTATYREKSRDYVQASKLLGASTPRMIMQHILPNVISTIVTLIPFSFAGVTTSLTALDFIGFGLPENYPSWGRTLSDGVANLDAPWIVSSVFISMVILLLLITFIGEAVREAFDPKKFTYYK
ncbi:MAG: ABC transporter permease subunit [Akkermansiaceae bacterium]